MVELSRLQLVRDNHVADSEGADDTTRGKKNAMRAVAVDDQSPPARLVLALATAHGFRGTPGSDADRVRGARLKLVALTASAIPKSEGTTEAAARALSGFLALEQGDRTRAKAAFDSASALDPTLAAAWAGLGDVHRSGKAYPLALEAYRKAAAFLPDDKGIEEGMALAEKGVALELPKAVAGGLENGAPLAPPGGAVPSCSSASVRSTGGQELCAGLDSLSRASAPKQFDAGAAAVVSGFQSLRSLCDQKDPGCGDFVAPALLAAARGFRSANLLAKSIATLRILISNASLPGGKELAQLALLEVADQYFAIGVFDEAASYYERYAKERAAGFEKARDRAAFIRSALQSGPAAKAPVGGVCPSPLSCGVRYILAERRWVAPRAKP